MNEIIQGDWIEVLKTLPDEFVQCVITSPPYWGLRDYGVEGQLGLEKTPEEYIEKVVDGFREIHRVLRKDGTVWLNLGDCHIGSWGNSGSRDGGQRPQNTQKYNRKAWDEHTQRPASSYPLSGLKPKDLCMMPHRVALALQADGWWVRMDNVWEKPDCMPESAQDRPTKSHEYVFLLSKSARYFYDNEAVREPQIKGAAGSNFNTGKTAIYQKNRASNKERVESSTRNLRSVWRIPTQGCSFAHFAAFPEKLANICILAGTAETACGICGAPYKREVNISGGAIGKGWNDHDDDQIKGNRAINEAKGGHGYERKTIAFWPTCEHDYFPIMDATGKCVVLDPFGGTNTVGYRAQEMGRNWIAIELKSKYKKYGDNRTAQQNLL